MGASLNLTVLGDVGQVGDNFVDLLSLVWRSGGRERHDCSLERHRNRDGHPKHHTQKQIQSLQNTTHRNRNGHSKTPHTETEIVTPKHHTKKQKMAYQNTKNKKRNGQSKQKHKKTEIGTPT